MFHCLVIKVSVVFDSSFTLSHLFNLVKNFLKFFQNSFLRCIVVGCSLTTCLLYHVFSYLSTTFLFFWKTFNFSYFQKQLFPTAQSDYHRRIHLSTTFFIFSKQDSATQRQRCFQVFLWIFPFPLTFFWPKCAFFPERLIFSYFFQRKIGRKRQTDYILLLFGWIL